MLVLRILALDREMWAMLAGSGTGSQAYVLIPTHTFVAWIVQIEK